MKQLRNVKIVNRKDNDVDCISTAFQRKNVSNLILNNIIKLELVLIFFAHNISRIEIAAKVIQFIYPIKSQIT